MFQNFLGGRNLGQFDSEDMASGAKFALCSFVYRLLKSDEQASRVFFNIGRPELNTVYSATAWLGLNVARKVGGWK